MARTLKFIPALLACCVLCLCSGCAGMGEVVARSDNHGGMVVFDTQGAYPRALARVDADGQRYVLTQDTGSIHRGAGGADTVSESVQETARADYCGPSDSEWWLAFTIVYLIVLLIEVIIAAIDEAD